MGWVRALLAIAMGLVALVPGRAAVGIYRNLHSARWPGKITRWALVNRLCLVADDVVTIYVYAVLGVNSLATIALLVVACATLVVARLERTGALADLSPGTRRVLGCIQCLIWLAPLALLLPSEPAWPLVLYVGIGLLWTISNLALGNRSKQDKEFARFLTSGR